MHQNPSEKLAWQSATLIRRAALALSAAATLALGVSSAHAAVPHFDGSSTNGDVVFFSTTERLVNGDTDGFQDVFERSKDEVSVDGEVTSEYVTREVSLGPTGGNDAYSASYTGSSDDGSRVFFSTQESLVPGDTDQAMDIYLRDLAENTTTLVSRADPSCSGATCGAGPDPVSAVRGGVVADGERVFFSTTEKLASGDDDGGASDVYVRDLSADTTTLVSRADSTCSGEGCGNGTSAVGLEAASEDGERAFLVTSERLVTSDNDGRLDIYLRDIGAGTTSLVTTEGTCPSGLPPDQTCDPVFGGVSNDGSHAFFETRERLLPADEDDSADVYDWSGGSVTLASVGPTGGNEDPFNVTYAGNSADGDAVYFGTEEALVSGDGDEVWDVYVRSAEATELISTGPSGGDGDYAPELKWVSPDGSTDAVIFTTAEPLVAGDEDESPDLYERSGGTTELVSTGPAGGDDPDNAIFSAAADDASHVFFGTTERLVAGDEDQSTDIYDRSGSTTTQVSIGALNGNGPFDAGLPGISSDGSIAFLTSEERLAEGDVDANEKDIYQRASAGTLLVSTGNVKALGPAPPSQLTTTPGSPGESLTPLIKGQADEGTAINVYTTPDCSDEPVATGTGQELATTGFEVEVEAGSITTFRATAEADGIVSACSAPVTYRQEVVQPPPPPDEEGGGTEGEKPPEKKDPGKKKGGGKGGSGNGGMTYVTPETQITFGPGFKTRRRKVVFRFTDATGQPGTSFICRIDRRRWRPCNSPKRLKKLRRGRHVFRVKARNAVGTWEARPTKRRFKIVGRRKRSGRR
jgi:Tol biopolymer transport system component